MPQSPARGVRGRFEVAPMFPPRIWTLLAFLVGALGLSAITATVVDAHVDAFQALPPVQRR